MGILPEPGLHFDADLLSVVYATEVPANFHHDSSPGLHDLKHRKIVKLEAGREDRDLPLHPILHNRLQHHPQPAAQSEGQAYL